MQQFVKIQLEEKATKPIKLSPIPNPNFTKIKAGNAVSSSSSSTGATKQHNKKLENSLGNREFKHQISRFDLLQFNPPEQYRKV